MKRESCVFAIALCALFVIACGDSGKTAVDNAAVPDDTVTDDTVVDNTLPDEVVTDDTIVDETIVDETANDAELPDETMTDEVAVDTEPPDEDTAPVYAFNGKWAMLNFTTSNVTTTIPIIGEQKSTSTTSGYALVELTDNGDGTVGAVGTTCDMVIDSGSDLLDIIISENYISHLSQTVWTFATLPDRGFNGYDLTATDVLTLNGLQNLVNPMTDPLPTDKNDPRVYDQDMDGHPGMTVNCEGHIFGVFNGPGTMYTVQRTIVDMVGETKNVGQIEGGLVWESQQVVLEASNSVLLNDKTIVPDYNNSWFKMVRIDNSWTCAEVKANEGTLFPQ